MSRGVGKVQAHILAAIVADGPSDIETLAIGLYGVCTRSGYEAVRRALRSLERQGRVQRCEGRGARVRVRWDDGGSSWRDQFQIVSVANVSP